MRLGFIITSQRISSESSVGRAWVPEAKEVQDTTICWQGDGHSTLGCKRLFYELFTQEKYNNWLYFMLNFLPKRSTMTGYYVELFTQEKYNNWLLC